MRKICANGISWNKMFKNVSDEEHSSKFKPTNIEQKTQSGGNKITLKAVSSQVM